MRLVVTIKPYLETLKLNEKHKLKELQREIPTLKELAGIVGLHRNSYSRLAQNETKEVNKDAIAKTIAELRRRGFDTQVSDILVYVDDHQ